MAHTAVAGARSVRARSAVETDLDAARETVKSAAPAITRAAAILSVLASQPQRAFGPSELSRKTGIPKSSVLNLCIAMSEVGFLRRDERGVRLHHRLAELGNAYLSSRREIEEFYDLCRTKLPNAAQTVQLGVLGDGLKVIFLARHDGREPLNLGRATEIGRSVPAHCTANGKALLAALSYVEFHARIPASGRLPFITSRSVNDVKALEDKLAEVRRQGYADEHGEIVRGLNCFGVAIRTPYRTDGLVGISFSCPEHLGRREAGNVGAELREFAELFAERLRGELAF